MTVSTSAGATIFIGPATAVEPADKIAYEALTWTEINEVESLGEFGDSSAAITFTALKDGRVRKRKGAKDAGDLALVVGYDPFDAGQLALIAAEATKFSYAIKVVLEDGQDANDTDSTFYFLALVMTKRLTVGDVQAITKRAYTLGITTKITEAPSTVVP